MGVRGSVCPSGRPLSEDRDRSTLPSLFLLQHLAHSSRAGCSCGTAKGTEYKRMAQVAEETEKDSIENQRKETPTSSFSLLSQEAQSKCEETAL